MSSALRVLLLLIGLLIYHEILVTYHEISICTHALFQGLWNPALLQATTQTTNWDWRIPTKMPFDKTFIQPWVLFFCPDCKLPSGSWPCE